MADATSGFVTFFSLFPEHTTGLPRRKIFRPPVRKFSSRNFTVRNFFASGRKFYVRPSKNFPTVLKSFLPSENLRSKILLPSFRPTDAPRQIYVDSTTSLRDAILRPA